MNYVRPSSLGVAEFCPRATELSEQSGISRAAVISTAWHAKLAGNDTLIGELHPDERKEVSGWGKPTDALVAGMASDGLPCSVGLDYDSAEKELPIELYEGPKLITKGTLDFAWVRQINGKPWAFIGDLKRSTWAIPDGPDCLQLAAYGHGYSILRSCVGYTPGLWSGTDNEWTWGTPVDLTSPDALDLWSRLKRAARNDYRLIPESKPDLRRFTTGAHCNACYGRQRCPEYAALTHDGPVPDVTPENAAELILRAKALGELADSITANVKVFAERGGRVVDPATKKVYLPTLSAGRKSLDQEALGKVVDLSKYQKVGKPFQTFGWRKP